MKRFCTFLHTPGRPEKHRLGYWLWNLFWVLFASVLSGGLCLLTSYGDYPYEFLLGYLSNRTLLIMNLLLPFWLMWMLYFLFGRAWPAFLVSSVLTLAPAAAGYFKLRFRDEVMSFSDLRYLKEGLNISQRYALQMDWKLWLFAAFIVVGTVAFALLVRGRPGKQLRIGAVILLAVGIIPMAFAYRSSDLYYNKGINEVCNSVWQTTEFNVSKGFWYSFLYSATDLSKQKPDGYNKRDVKKLLEEYPDEDIPQKQKADVIAIQLEAFSDLTRLGLEGIAPETYEYYHELEQESYTGDLVTSTFAAGTIKTERSFLTGLYYCEIVRQDTDSYPWYFANQGYHTQFSHGSNDWFYNRANVSDYLGFEESYFLENYFADVTGGGISYDDTYFPAILDLYDQAKADGKPYFGFHVTYQGHGPYSNWELHYGDTWYTQTLSKEGSYILNNYLGGLYDTQQHLKEFIDELRDRDDPVIVILYGDHKPWLGDGNSIYAELGIDLNAEEETGFYNYYSTRYLIWGNDAARDLFGEKAFSGEGPAISPMYLMGEMFDRVGWSGPSLMQVSRVWQRTLPVISSAGYTVETGRGVTYGDLSDLGFATLDDCHCVTFYKRNNFTMR